MRFTAIAFALGTIALACGETETPPSVPGSTEGKTPPKADGTPATSTDERTFAINALYLSETDRNGVANEDAWKSIGYNIDGLVTNAADSSSPDLTKVCKRVSGADATVHQDGNEGIDNAFGAKILKLIKPISASPSKSVTDTVLAGDFTVLFKLKGLTDDPNQTNTGISGSVLVGAKFGATPPTFSTTEEWPYVSEPQVSFADAYVNQGTFVSGTQGTTIRLRLSLQGQFLELTVTRALITFKHDGDTLTEGTIAGVVKTSEVVDSVAQIAGRVSPAFCSGAAVESIKGSIRQASDILYDGAQDPSKECDAISIGIGFTAKRIAKPGAETAPAPPPASPCAP